MNLLDAIKALKEIHYYADNVYNNITLSDEDIEAIDTVVKELEKPTYTPADMEEFSYWYHRKVSVIGESELHLFGVRLFEDIISFWKKEKETTE